MKKIVAIVMSVIVIILSSMTALADSVKVALLELICEQSFTESEADQTAKIDLEFTYTADGQATTVDAPHKYITLESSSDAIVLNEVVVKSVNGNGTEYYDKDSDIVDDVDTNPWPAYIDSDGKDISGGKFLVETYVDETRKTDFESVVLTATYTIPANTPKGEYTITATADATDYTEADYADVTADYTLVIAEKVVEPECDHANAEYTLVNVTETEFIYTGTCSDCSEPVEKRIAIGTPLETPISISKTLQPRNDVSILLEVPTTSLAGYTDFVVVANKEEYASGATEPDIVPYYITEYADSTVYSGYTEFIFGKINAYEMNNNVHFVLYGKDTVGNMIQLGTLDYSVVAYVVSSLPKALSATRTAELKTMLVDMLIYSSKVQEYGDFNVANLAVDEIKGLVETGTNKSVMEYATPESEWPTAVEDVNALSDTKTYNVDNSTVAGTLKMSKTLELSNRVNTLFVITAKGTADINDIYIKYEYYDVQGNAATPYVAKYEGAMYQNMYPAFVFDKAPVSVYDYPIKATAYYGDPDNGGVEIAYASYNPASYISKNCPDSSSVPAGLRVALRALNAYAKSLAVLADVSPYSAQ